MQYAYSILKTFLKLCPYTHLWRAIKTAVKERKFPASARRGGFIAILGLFCPLFWAAYLRGATGGELAFHAAHSGLFVLIGIVLMLAGIAKQHK